MQKRVWAVLFVFLTFAPAAAMADPTTIGVQLGATRAVHREEDGGVSALAPVPILTASHRSGCIEISAEGLPPVGPVGFTNNGLGMKDITLSYADAVARYWNPSHTVALGIGETLYNQRTDFLERFRGGQQALIDRSRVAGTRYELVVRRALRTRDAAQVSIAVNPAMHGRYTQTQMPQGAPGWGFTTPPIWEHASQVDADARFTHAFGAYAISYGVRYLNYNAAFDSLWQPQFADANALVMPYVALTRTFGEAPNAPNKAAPACARPRIPIIVRAFLGGEVFTGAHQDADGSVRGAAVASLPLYALRAAYKQYELLLEGVPAVGPIRGRSRFARAPYDVKAGYGAGVLRYWLPKGGIGLGIGDSLYVSQRHVFGHVHVAERAAGLRYEILDRMQISRGTQMQIAAAISPSMHQRGTFWVDDARAFGARPGFGTGSLVDASVQFETLHGSRHSWVYGVRYLNYAGGTYYRYDGLKDRTGIIGGFAAWGFRIGR
ncbi:MAG TPA: hypothetical protein VFN37_02580 [Candidatus Baltobacteraceae bacterium]|nr:hypothetical protein [Candidatus Baltobacteraceae bacterium]